jgi:hypothetical protein
MGAAVPTIQDPFPGSDGGMGSSSPMVPKALVCSSPSTAYIPCHLGYAVGLWMERLKVMIPRNRNSCCVWGVGGVALLGGSPSMFQSQLGFRQVVTSLCLSFLMVLIIIIAPCTGLCDK